MCVHVYWEKQGLGHAAVARNLAVSRLKTVKGCCSPCGNVIDLSQESNLSLLFNTRSLLELSSLSRLHIAFLCGRLLNLYF